MRCFSKMNFPRFLRLLVSAMSVFVWCAGARAERPMVRPPNVLVILADDQGWGDLGVNGNTDIATPRIDALARSGATLEHFYVCPVCAPTRAEFFTGRFYARTGVQGVSTGQERLNLDETTIGDVFQRAGYATGAFGKWHNGTQWPYHPNARGFQEFYGFCSGHWGHYFDPELDHNGRMVRGKGFIIDDLTEHAMAFMAENRARPFLCYVPYNTPHSPMQVPERFYAKFAGREITQRSVRPMDEDLAHTRAALAMCENLDWNVGRLLDHLDQLGLSNDTVVVYFSDNGPNGWRYNGGFKGRKGAIDEGGVRSPCFVRFPGKIPAGLRVPQVAGAIDLLPTLADFAGVPLESKKPLDGRSFRALLTSANPAATPWGEHLLYSTLWGGKGAFSVRSQEHRLDAAGGLYAIDRDPGQMQNLVSEFPQEAARLRKAGEEFMASLPASFKVRDARPFTVGYAASTPLPARDGVAHGTVKRSAKAPNCSYFTHWTKPEDEITWEVEVAEAGEYEVVLYYTCAPENVGAVVECSFEGQSVRAKVSEANNPPAIGAADDRSERVGESYVKDFKPMSLGRLQCKAGRGTLRLRAPEIPGSAAVEVRYVVLQR